ncbi:MAG TPA: hypothetical protein VN408_04815 [Actinoplanes sp.]|nr:hypothetical protein [Actinoplanes sp.]
MAFRRDVAFMHEVEPGLMRVNGEEFARVVKSITDALPTLVSVPTKVEWQSEAADLCRIRLAEAESLAHDLREGYGLASAALLTYADALASAKAEMDRGDAANSRLRDLIEPLTGSQTQRVRDSEPLAQWEDLRTVTSWYDGINENGIQDRVDAVRDQAEDLYYEAAGAYSRVRDIEQEARDVCLAEMKKAFQRLPDFEADTNAAGTIIVTAPGVTAEMGEAGALNTDVRLPGHGPVPAFSVDGTDGLTGIHEDLRRRILATSTDVPTEWDPMSAVWGRFVDPEHEQQYKMGWISTNQGLIQAAAQENGIPAGLLAGIVYQEAGGKPPVGDHIADWVRRHGLDGKDADDTSFGLLGIQVDTAAVALGYDPANLSAQQREELVKSLDDPRQSIAIAARVLADAKDSTDFAGVDPRNMTPEQERQLAAKYNGGPDWDKPIAQGYAANYESARHDVDRVLWAS